jgi:predicted site-specific integrase-resolvase
LNKIADMTEKKTLREAAFCIGVHWRTLYRWTLEGTILYIQHKVNGPIFIPEDEIKRICKAKYYEEK